MMSDSFSVSQDKKSSLVLQAKTSFYINSCLVFFLHEAFHRLHTFCISYARQEQEKNRSLMKH